MQENILIYLDGVSKIYRIGGGEVRALDKASLKIRKGEFVSIIGPSGSGKSTMMNIIGCLDLPDEGTYYLDGQPVEGFSRSRLARVRNRQIGFVFQNFNLIGNMSAGENVELPLIYQRLPGSERKERVDAALEMVGLSKRRAHRPNELSGGQQQRVAIARAIAARPSLFLCDEPTGNLDSSTGEEIMEIFCRLHREGNTVVLITHDEEVAARASRKIRIRDGKVSEVSKGC